MANAKKAIMWILGTLITLLILLALIDQVTTRVFGFDLLSWLAFGNALTIKVYAWIVGIVGGLGLISMLLRSLAKTSKLLR